MLLELLSALTTIIPFWENAASTCITTCCEITARKDCGCRTLGTLVTSGRMLERSTTDGGPCRFKARPRPCKPRARRNLTTICRLPNGTGGALRQPPQQFAAALRVALYLAHQPLEVAVRRQLPLQHLRVHQNASHGIGQLMHEAQRTLRSWPAGNVPSLPHVPRGRSRRRVQLRPARLRDRNWHHSSRPSRCCRH